MNIERTDNLENDDDDDYIGEVNYIFKPKRSNAVAGVIIAVLLVIAGIVMVGFSMKGYLDAGGNLPLNAEKGHSWFSVGVFSLFGLAAIIGGGALIYYAIGLFAYRVEFCEDGLRIICRGKKKEYPFYKTTGVFETITHEKPPIVKGPAKMLLPTHISRSYLIIQENGKQFSLDVNQVSEMEKFSQMLYDVVEERGINWESQNVHPNPYR